MKLTKTTDEVVALLETMISEQGQVTVNSIEMTPWGVKVGFDIESVSIDMADIISDAQVNSVYVGEEDFVISHVIRMQFDPCDDEEDKRPAGIIVGTHTMGESNDEEYCASIYGELFLLADGADKHTWEIAATQTQDKIMRTCIDTALKKMLEMMTEATDTALKGISGKRHVRHIMRRLAAAA